MGRFDVLADNFETFVRAPWPRHLSGYERIVMLVYPKEEELRLRMRVEDFAHRAISAGHQWRLLDITSLFPQWLAAQDYREEYFRYPEDLELKLEEFTAHCIGQLRAALESFDVDETTIVAMVGAGALFGVTRLHRVLDKVQDAIKGRLLVFFPGSFEQSNYRLLDARDGLSYLATPIVA